MNESTEETNRLLTQLAQRAQNEVGLMARVLVRYRQLEQLADDALAAQLQTDALGLARLSMCKQPASDARFVEQVREIAAYANADAAQIANVIRYVESMDALAEKPTATITEETTQRPLSKWTGVVAAARDREESASKENDDNVAGPGESERD